MDELSIDSIPEDKLNNNLSIKNSKLITKFEKLNVPKSICIGQYTYIFKDQFKSDNNIFSNRCKKI